MSTLNRDAELSTLSNAAYMDSPPTQIGNWVKLIPSQPSNSGFFAVAYRNPQTKQIVVAYRGTDGVSDLAADLAFKTGAWNAQFEEAVAFTAQIRNSLLSPANKDYSLLTTGHSLGGGISQLMAKMFGLNGSSYDAPGANNILNSAGYKAAAARYAPDSGQQIGASFFNYTAQGSLISSVSSHLGNTQSLGAVNNQ